MIVAPPVDSICMNVDKNQMHWLFATREHGKIELQVKRLI